jgi:riboflavin synthase
MFTGITRGTFPVSDVRRSGSILRYTVDLPAELASGLELGASVAIEGVCQTVVEITPSANGGVGAAFQAIDETLRRTTLGALQKGASVSVERSARLSDELGGHLLAGHVSGTGTVLAVQVGDGVHDLQIEVPPAFMKYVLPKGFIAVDGSSLTVGLTDPRGSFWLHLIPETLRVTNLGHKGPGDRVNVELDAHTVAIVDTVERVLHERARSEGQTETGNKAVRRTREAGKARKAKPRRPRRPVKAAKQTSSHKTKPKPKTQRKRGAR